MSADGRPKTVVNDHAEAEFAVLTYDKKPTLYLVAAAIRLSIKARKECTLVACMDWVRKFIKGI